MPTYRMKYVAVILLLSMVINLVLGVGAVSAQPPADGPIPNGEINSARADALVLVNSASAGYADFQHFVQPYLDNFGIPYSVLDVATTPVAATIADYAVIIVGHRQLDVDGSRLDGTEEGYITSAVSGGTGLVNFDNVLSSDGSTPNYQFVDSIFSFGYTTPPTLSGVAFPSPQTHYITQRHTAGETISTGNMTMAGITLPTGVDALALTGTQPFLAATVYGQGRAVQWGTYDWMSHAVKGPLFDLDDLVWRSIVWAARKPFAMQGMPPFVTMRMDDVSGPLWWVHTANDYGFIPWLGIFTDDIDAAEAADMSSLVNNGNATATIHAFGSTNFFYFDHSTGANFSDATMAANYAAATQWFSNHNIPISKYVVPHFYEIGSNAFGGLQTWGTEFIGTMMDPGQSTFVADWMTAGPYRLYESGPASDMTHNPYYADFMTIPGHPELDGAFFNCVTEIRDVTGYEWLGGGRNGVPEAIQDGTEWLKRALDSMALATLFSHEYTFIGYMSQADWQTTIEEITQNIASYNPIYVSMDYACQYARAMKTSNIAQSQYDPVTNQVTVTLNGASDMATKFYLFTGDPGHIEQTLVDVPAFSGSTQVVYTIPLHFAFDPISSPQYVGVPFEVAIRAQDGAGNPVLTYTGQASLSDSTGTIQPALTGNFTGGVWTGTVTIGQSSTADVITASDGAAAGTSSAFNVWPMLHSIWDDTATPAVASENDPNAIEVGVKFRADVDGFITGIRFYKGSGNTGTHIGSLWTSSGQLLATATFVNETASGWQQVDLAAPVQIQAGTTYVASYHTDVGMYALDENYFALGGVDNSPLHALANGVDGGNGVYKYGPTAFPTASYGASNYWVDVVFTQLAGPDIYPPQVSVTSPVPGAANAAPDIDVTVVFNEAVDPATVNSSTFELRDGANNVVPATLSYNGSSHTATLNPADTLPNSMTFTATVKGGIADPRVKDLAGNALASDYIWSFTTADPPPPPPDDGPGGPILVISSVSNPFSRYYSEILRAEGFYEFLAVDIAQVSASTLSAYDVAILGEMSLSSAQVTMLSDWVTAGGNLIAMRPDKQLAGLLGLADASSTLSNAYLQVDTSRAPGRGIVADTMQFHGTADLYDLSGASTVATLYSNATTATSSPAVTIRDVGTNGGQAASFTYDLARSVVYTRQGNPAWAGQERDGTAPIRSDDMFYGAAAGDPQPDWIDLNKVAIPQADEQQRLLGNLVLHMNLDRKPLPRFWYFPKGLKAVVVMTGDDHTTGSGTAGRFDQYDALSPVGCSVENWECLRSTSYISNDSELTDAQVAAFAAKGFEAAVHINTGCLDYTPSSLDSTYNYQLSAFLSRYPSSPAPTTNRTHCIVWSDWATQPTVEHQYGIRLDTNYYYWPGSWIADRPGFFTGSGMPMRFADLDGTIIDVFQAATQMTDESAQSYPSTIDALLDKALGPEGFYGAFTANMHTDSVSSPGSDAIIASAQARGVPVVSARQMLRWLDGRNGSSFGSLTLTDNVLTFSITVGTGANNLRAMLPAQSALGTITGITYNGTPISFTTETIKGVAYATFPAQAGVYQAQLLPDTQAPTVTLTDPVSGAVVSGIVTIAADAADDVAVAGVQFLVDGVNAGAEDTLPPYSIAWNSTTVTNGLHQLTAVARDVAGNTTTSSPASVTVDNLIDTTPPTVAGVTPAAGATDVAVNAVITVSFSEAMDPATINGTTFELRDGANNVVSAVVSYNAGILTATLDPAENLAYATAYTARVKGGTVDPRVKDVAGNALTADYVWSFSTVAASPFSSIWNDTATPATPSVYDPAAIEVGVKFRSDIDGYITAIRFYKGSLNTGTHIGNLWTSTGQLLATATFVNETESGWQQVSLATPVAITANTTYVASYHTDVGRYAADGSYFASSGVYTPPLRALANGVDGGNGVYKYGPTGFPTSSYNATNYWVDVVFATTVAPDTTPPTVSVATPLDGVVVWGMVPVIADAVDDVGVAGVQFLLDGANLGAEDTVPPYSISWDSRTATNGAHQLTALARDGAGNQTTSAAVSVTVDNDITLPTVAAVTPAAGATDVALVAVATVTFSEAMDPATINATTFELRDGANNVVSAVVSYDPGTLTATLDPAENLAYATAYTARVKGGTVDPRVKDVAGNALAADYVWSFSTATASAFTSIWNDAVTPAIPSMDDPSAIEVGVKFRSDLSGYITAIRFYKGSLNTGTHIGNLWTSSGQLLATATFVNETASGWQQVNLVTPVAITTNTTYVASYHTDVGRYAADSLYFASGGVYTPPLRALANGVDGGNGVYSLGPTGFPTSSYNATNYWVDVVFATTVAPDTTPPTVSMTNPAGGAVVVGTISVAADGADNVAVAGVQFLLDGANLGAEDTVPPYSILWDSRTATNGAHQLAAVARDGAGNQTTSAAVNVTVDNDLTAPTVTAVTPAAGATDVALVAVTTVTFSEAMDPATIDATTFELRDGAGNLVAATVSYEAASQTASLVPTAALANSSQYTARVKGGTVDPRVKDAAGNALAADYVWSFTTVAAPAFSSIWADTATPANPSRNDSRAIEVGVKFRSDVAGYITAIRFYKGTLNTGTHIGNLWTSTGQLLATATFVNEAASGWQQVNLATPVAISANTTYVASYHTDVGRYAGDNYYFETAGVYNPPLRALANGVDGGNGVYKYGATSFPTTTNKASNYWVDVVFTTAIAPDTTPPTVSVTNPASGAVVVGTISIAADATDNVAVAGVQFLLDGANLGAEDTAAPYSISWDSRTVTNGVHQLAAIARDGAGNQTASAAVNVNVDNDITAPTVTAVTPVDGAIDVGLYAMVTATFSKALDPATVNGTTFELRDAANNLVSAAVSYDAGTLTATLDPAGALIPSTAYTARVKGGTVDPRVKDVVGNALAADYVWSFTTAAASASSSIWDATATPATPSTSDKKAVEVGVKFRSDVAGYITGLRFYKGSLNTGTHIGNLWTGTGQLLATATFVNETASGWQQVNLATPVAISANTTYVASYHTDVGRYAADSLYFATAGVYTPPLQALATGVDGGNGVYKYGTTGFPTSSHNATNYWVDVVFATTIAPDTTPPTVSVTNPANGAIVVGTVTLTADAADNVAVAGVQFLLDGANIGAEDTVPPYSISWDSRTATNGAHQLAAVARDGAGNQTTSAAVNVTVDNDLTAPTVTAVTPAAGATDVALVAVTTVTFSEAMDPATINGTTFELRDGAGNLVAATVSYEAASQTASLVPSAALANSTQYTAKVKGGAVDPRVKDAAGNALAADYVWSFTTAAAPPFSTIWHATATPANPSRNDQRAVEVGVKFRSDVAGYITAIRFYKGDLNTGTHIGNLWTSTGQLLATATFVNETASGWQQVNLATPVAIAANTTYVASYHTDVGRYAGDNYYFATAGVYNPPLRALADGVDGGNGVYKYGATAFPTSTNKASNYWVDVVFTTTP